MDCWWPWQSPSLQHRIPDNQEKKKQKKIESWKIHSWRSGKQPWADGCGRSLVIKEVGGWLGVHQLATRQDLWCLRQSQRKLETSNEGSWQKKASSNTDWQGQRLAGWQRQRPAGWLKQEQQEWEELVSRLEKQLQEQRIRWLEGRVKQEEWDEPLMRWHIGLPPWKRPTSTVPLFIIICRTLVVV